MDFIKLQFTKGQILDLFEQLPEGTRQLLLQRWGAQPSVPQAPPAPIETETPTPTALNLDDYAIEPNQLKTLSIIWSNNA